MGTKREDVVRKAFEAAMKVCGLGISPVDAAIAAFETEMAKPDAAPGPFKVGDRVRVVFDSNGLAFNGVIEALPAIGGSFYSVLRDYGTTYAVRQDEMQLITAPAARAAAPDAALRAAVSLLLRIAPVMPGDGRHLGDVSRALMALNAETKDNAARG